MSLNDRQRLLGRRRSAAASGRVRVQINPDLRSAVDHIGDDRVAGPTIIDSPWRRLEPSLTATLRRSSRRAHLLSHSRPIIGRMSHEYFSPWCSEPVRCWHCSSFVAMVYEGSAAICTATNHPRIRSQPHEGFSSYSREPGADDEPDAVPSSLDPSVTIRALSRLREHDRTG